MSKTEEALLKRKEELTARLEAIRTDLGKGLAADSEEQAVQLENFEVLQEIQRLADEELKQVQKELDALKQSD
jgi:RNA polymerase-binding transcription factor DksA